MSCDQHPATVTETGDPALDRCGRSLSVVLNPDQPYPILAHADADADRIRDGRPPCCVANPAAYLAVDRIDPPTTPPVLWYPVDADLMTDSIEPGPDARAVAIGWAMDTGDIPSCDDVRVELAAMIETTKPAPADQADLIGPGEPWFKPTGDRRAITLRIVALDDSDAALTTELELAAMRLRNQITPGSLALLTRAAAILRGTP